MADHLEIAKKACEYARERILLGSTQVENNNLPEWQKAHLFQGVHKDLRPRIQDPFIQIEDDTVDDFEGTIFYTTKYSLGNCYELALQALDYCLMENEKAEEKVRAEVFRLKGGDHVFLVIGRRYGSLENDPKTWGDDAVICDPWANKYYPAKEYLQKLRDFYSVKNENFTKPFSHKTHQFEVVSDMNTNYLAAQRNWQNISKNFQKKCIDLLGILRTYEKKLIIMREKLENEGKNYSILDAKINKIKEIKKEIKAKKKEIAKMQEGDGSYREQRDTLRSNLKRYVVAVTQVTIFEKVQKKELFKDKDNSFSARFMRFFHLKTTTKQELKRARKNVYASIRKLGC